MKINLGSGANYKEGFINIDLYSPGISKVGYTDSAVLPDIIGRGELIGYFIKPNCIDHIEMVSVLEHFNKYGRAMTLVGCNNVLKIGGTLYINVPDVFQVMQSFINLNEKERKPFYMLLWGWHEYPGDIHCDGFTEEKLKNEVERYGFEIVRSNIGTDPLHPCIDMICKKVRQVDETTINDVRYLVWKKIYLNERVD